MKRVATAGLMLALMMFSGACGDGAENATRAAAPEPEGSDANAGSAIEYGEGRMLSQLQSTRVNESSGLAESTRRDGLFWTHNDSGDGPFLYAFDSAGHVLALVRIEGADSYDYEDMASYELDGEHWLIVGDFGDNARRRPSCSLYIVHEPNAIGDANRAARRSVSNKITIRYEYQGGARNCESVGVDTERREIVIVSKTRRGPCHAYVTSLPEQSPGRTLTLEPVAELDLPTTSAMDISPDGRRALVCTYGEAYEFVRAEGQTWGEAFQAEPRRIELPRRMKGEGLTYGRDGKTIYLTSEGAPMPLLEVEAKAMAGDGVADVSEGRK